MADKGIKIAVLSGKGGTGKTLVSVNLASVAGGAAYVDCDVEEPDGYLFFKPCDVQKQDVLVQIPVFDEKRCNGCRKCVDFCRFNAIAFVGKKPRVFEEVCHSCGGCSLVCESKAITERGRIVGSVQTGASGDVSVYTGVLNEGEASGVPVIRKLLDAIGADQMQLVIIDCPPGSACTVMESIRDADYCILVAEPTVFGAHNLEMVHELVRVFEKPYGVVLNKCLAGEENPSRGFCEHANAHILCEISFDPALGTLTSNGEIASRLESAYTTLFSSLLDDVKKEVANETASDSQR